MKPVSIIRSRWEWAGAGAGMARITRGRLPHVQVAADMVPIPVAADMVPIPAAVAEAHVPAVVEVRVPAVVEVRGDNNADRLPAPGIYIHALTI